MTTDNLDCDVIIVGAGLSGLACANLLHNAGLKTIILEASDRIGGRIHSIQHQETIEYAADLGPTWVWPEYQPVLSKWLENLKIGTFDQFNEGDGIVDFEENKPVQRHPIAGQYAIRRICGGPQALIDKIYTALPSSCIQTGQKVTAIELTGNAVSITTGGPEKKIFKAEKVVVAAPLAIASEAISWSDCLDEAVVNIMSNTPTWMATQAKAVIMYDRPFWREKGLSGRIASQAGPLVEVHDHCLPQSAHATLFGFVGWPFVMRQNRSELLKTSIIDQLIRCFGKEAANFNTLHIEDWALNKNICSQIDLSLPPAHPLALPDLVRSPHYNGRLFFTVSETAVQSPGLIEGAFSAANDTVNSLLATQRKN